MTITMTQDGFGNSEIVDERAELDAMAMLPVKRGPVNL